MDTKTKEIYSEVYGILNMLGKNYIEKLPSNLYKMIKQEKINEYNPQYDSSIALEQQNIKKESLSMIALFHLNYWCDSQDEKNKLKELFENNEIKYQTELREKYNPDNLFKNRQKSVENDYAKENTMAMVEYKESIFRKIINKIKGIFHR